MGTLKKMASDPHLNGIPTVMDGVQHNMAFGKQFRDNRPVNTIRADTLTSDVTIDANHHEGKSVSVVNLTFRYNSLYHEAPIVLDNVTVQLEPGARIERRREKHPPQSDGREAHSSKQRSCSPRPTSLSQHSSRDHQHHWKLDPNRKLRGSLCCVHQGHLCSGYDQHGASQGS